MFLNLYIVETFQPILLQQNRGPIMIGDLIQITDQNWISGYGESSKRPAWRVSNTILVYVAAYNHGFL